MHYKGADALLIHECARTRVLGDCEHERRVRAHCCRTLFSASIFPNDAPHQMAPRAVDAAAVAANGGKLPRVEIGPTNTKFGYRSCR